MTASITEKIAWMRRLLVEMNEADRLMDAAYLATAIATLEAQPAMLAVIESEREARQKCEIALRKKDEAMGVLFSRLQAAGIDCSDLIS